MNTTSLINKFWARVLGTPNGTSMLLKNPLAPKGELLNLDWRTAGSAVALIINYLIAKGFKKGDRAAILAWNCPEWVWADLAIQSLGGITVSIYPNSSTEQVNYVLNDSKATLLFTNEKAQLAKVNTPVDSVHFDEIPDCFNLGGNEEQRKFHEHFLLDPLFYCGFSAPDLSGISADDLATLIYSSGSTGIPKGCMITHGNISGALTALEAGGFELDPATDRYLSYLPLAHVYERVNGMALCIWNGIPVAFSTVDEVKHEIGKVHPTMLCGVPAVWRKIKAGIDEPKDALPAWLNKHGLWQPLLKWALNQKRGLGKKLADLIVLNKIRLKLGGRLKLLVSGGAPIAPELLEFFNKLGLELLEGYGATETTGGISTNRPSAKKGLVGIANKVGSVGQLLPGACIKLVPEEGEEDAGVAEIWLGGPQIFRGYWGKPELTADALVSDEAGLWYKTGDLGRLDADGFLYISGRKDGMYKTDGGKYVAKEKIEKVFETHSIVQCVVPVAQGRKFTSALIFVNQATARALAGADTPSNADEAAEFFSKNPAVLAAVEKAVGTANEGLEQWEKVKKFVIMPLEATVTNGLLTPTLKIRTKEAHKRFSKEIEAIYEGAK
ncbi:MAG: AMP-binding protein [Candidatus Obscuribacterales bacterium]|jgi:long-chain acyl-CoA synthetase|nr:AMP-binding protein [Candidatus Obscuribacterales bacterium]